MSNEKRRIKHHQWIAQGKAQLTLKSILGAILSKIWTKWVESGKMVALLHEEEEEENREQRWECGGGKCWEKEKETKETKETGRSPFCWCFPGNMRTALTKIS